MSIASDRGINKSNKKTSDDHYEFKPRTSKVSAERSESATSALDAAVIDDADYLTRCMRRLRDSAYNMDGLNAT